MASGVLLVHGLSSDSLGSKVSDDSHHGGTSVVKLNIKLADLLLWVNDFGTEVTDSVVSVVLGGRHPCKLNKGEESKDLGDSGSWDGEESLDAGRDIRELPVIVRVMMID
jgi:hypothetical protein